MTCTVQELLVDQLNEAYAMEQTVAKMLDGMIRTTHDPSIVSDLETHKEETEEHAEKLKRCLEGYGESPSKVKEAMGALAAFAKAPMDLARGEQDMRNARDGFATEHLEIATYRLIQELAKAADDKQALQVAAENIADEERMAARIQRNWERVVRTSIEEEGVETA
jgi:ferritin-like metal-binding protein YciE